MVEKEKEDPSVEVIHKWIKGMSDGTYGYEVETSSIRGLVFVKAHKGFFLSSMIIHNGLLVINQELEALIFLFHFKPFFGCLNPCQFLLLCL